MSSKSNLQLGELYSEPGVNYECTAFGGGVALECHWKLAHEQGGEGQLFPSCTEVSCSEGASCLSLQLGLCPLTSENNDDLNPLEVRVMKGLRRHTLIESGDIIEVGDPQPEGRVIWFGAVRVRPQESA
ncbi:MAG: hypothetical protein QGG36_01160 [Pirellulaceae bacterium]|jgi:hypothetical protein|nr:hypothetical protein [Pirellulaceae bacterium]MDP7014386.1 hypothetical protein [Pirellulaceae bacterium]